MFLLNFQVFTLNVIIQFSFRNSTSSYFTYTTLTDFLYINNMFNVFFSLQDLVSLNKEPKFYSFLVPNIIFIILYKSCMNSFSKLFFRTVCSQALVICDTAAHQVSLSTTNSQSLPCPLSQWYQIYFGSFIHNCQKPENPQICITD